MYEELWTLTIAWIIAGLAAFGYLLRRVERTEERLKREDIYGGVQCAQ